jgi:hypothetical protein
MVHKIEVTHMFGPNCQLIRIEVSDGIRAGAVCIAVNAHHTIPIVFLFALICHRLWSEFS